MYGLAKNGSASRTTTPAATTEDREPGRITMRPAASDPARAAGAEQPGRAHDEHQHDDDERADILEFRVQVTAREVLDDPDADAAQHRAGQTAEAAEHRGGEGLHEQHRAEIGIDERE